ncbi:MAG: CBS domain-containing protein [Peptococcaceae bacterium]|nr:CBS domain-containing protein [Peptococcaceae bacterium]
MNIPEIVKVKELMLPIEEYSTVYEDDTVDHAIDVLHESFRYDKNFLMGHRSLIVLNREKHPVGILTLRNILSAMNFDEVMLDLQYSTASWASFYNWHTQNWTKLKVRDIMRNAGVIHVHPDTSALEAIKIVAQKGVNVLPVVENHEVVGVVRTIELFDFIAHRI